MYGCGYNHGFSTEVATNKSGRQTVYVYATNVGAGGNVLLGLATVDIGNVSPLIVLDSLHSDSTGTVTVEGWAFDPSDTSKAISVHAYAFVGEQPHFLGGTIADLERKDVNKTYGCGDNHGFKATFCTPISGNVRINVAAINIGGGENIWGAERTVTVAKDSDKPVVTNTKVENVTPVGYTVTCDVSDNVGVKEVVFPTWTVNDGQDDMKWYVGTVEDGKASCVINTSNHSNQAGCKYRTHIYAKDYMGNEGGIELDDVEVPLPISNVTVSDVDASGYTVACDINKAWGANRISYPTWTQEDGQDDLVWHAGTISNGKATCRIQTKDHGNTVCKPYRTDIYVYDSKGNAAGPMAVRVTPHNLTHVAAKAPTPEKEGSVEHWACEDCGKVFADAAAESELSKADVAIQKGVSLSDASIVGLVVKTYNGQAQTQSPTVKIGSVTLSAGTDYTLSYENNVNVGTATMTVTGKGNYSGTKSATFEIIAKPEQPTVPEELTTPVGPAEPIEPAVEPTPTVEPEPTGPAEPSKESADPAIPIGQDPSDDHSQDDRQQAGSTTVKPTSITGAAITGVKDKTYTGKALTQSPTVKVAGNTLKAGTDYELTYANNVKAGTATMTVTGKGSYTDTKQVKFTIAKANIKNADAKVKAQKYRKGKVVKPSPKLTYKGKTLKKGADYTLKYKDNKKRGTATITVKGKGNFKGSKTVKFKIS